jgi:hydrogenase-4 component B
MNQVLSTLIITLPLWFIGVGLLEVLLMPLVGSQRSKLRKTLSGLFVVFATGVIIALYPLIIQAPIIYRFEDVLGFGVVFKIDFLNYILMSFAGIMFFVVGLFAINDITHDQHQRSFYFFYMLTFIATIGSLMAADLLSFFLFFELMTFSTYGMIVHYRCQDAYEAGNEYIYLGIIGGLAILGGIITLGAYTGSLEWVNLAEKFSMLGITKYIIGGLFLLGFGMKAGVVPLHFWVPRVYESAPFTLNAISSAILTKVGAYGIFRVATVLFFSDTTLLNWDDALRWVTAKEFGVIIIWLGIATMVIGVTLALLEGNVKRMLAYHSISQMGYIVMGIGVASYLGVKGAMGYSGALYHMINHGIFKTLLFMVAGVVVLKTKETNMYRLGGLAKRFPGLAFLALFGVLGIMGIPLFNGFASKSMLHHAIEEAIKYGDPSFRYAEMLFTLVSAGTVTSFIKFYSFIFLGEEKTKIRDKTKSTRMMYLAMSILAVMIIFIGLQPRIILDTLLIPAVLSFSYDPAFIATYLSDMVFFNMKDIFVMVRVVGLGSIIFFLGIKLDLFHLHLPTWLNLEAMIYKPVEKMGENLSDYVVEHVERPLMLGDVLLYVILLFTLLLTLIFRL